MCIGIRAEDISVAKSASPLDILSGEVYVVENMGEEDIVQIKVGANFIKAIVPIDIKARIGERVFLHFKEGKVHFFDTDTEERIKGGDAE